MLRSLYIENLAVISRAEVSFTEGFNVFTGETGAGKTILLSALGAVLGQRTPKDMIRAGEAKAVVTAAFSGLSRALDEKLEELGYTPDEEGVLLLSRVIRPDSTECRVNGQPATAAILRSLAPLLVDLHGQHDNARLLSPEYHLSLIDRFGGHEQLLKAYQQEYGKLRSLQEELEKLNLDEGERARRIDLLTYQVQEISQAALTPGEDAELEAQRTLMRNAGKVASALGTAKELLNPEYSEERGILEQLGSLGESLQEASRFIPELQESAQRVSELGYELEEVGRDLGSYLEAVEFSPQQLDETENRLDLIHTLKTKYGPGIEDVLAYGERAEQELETLSDSDERWDQLQREVQKQQQKAQELAGRLTQARRRAGAAFSRAVEQELSFLDMPRVKLVTSQSAKELGMSGADTLEFLISPNPGEAPKPVQKIASGGEISRIMLSIKNVLSAEGDGVVSIFDEVDTGVSGRAADKIGQKLAAVSRGRQVLCVTHLAQVAAYADRHLLIRKESKGGRAFTNVFALDGEARQQELARIISGDAITQAAIAAAKEMIALAGEKKISQG